MNWHFCECVLVCIQLEPFVSPYHLKNEICPEIVSSLNNKKYDDGGGERFFYIYGVCVELSAFFLVVNEQGHLRQLEREKLL